jgi:hypothetical protein
MQTFFEIYTISFSTAISYKRQIYVVQGACQRLALPAAGGTSLAHETEKIQSHENSHFSGANPAVRVHAVLAGSDIDSLESRCITIKFSSNRPDSLQMQKEVQG